MTNYLPLIRHYKAVGITTLAVGSHKRKMSPFQLGRSEKPSLLREDLSLFMKFVLLTDEGNKIRATQAGERNGIGDFLELGK